MCAGKSCQMRRYKPYPRYMLPASIYIVFYPAQHSPVHFLLRWHVEIVAGDQIQNLDDKTAKLMGCDILYSHFQNFKFMLTVSLCQRSTKNCDHESFLASPDINPCLLMVASFLSLDLLFFNRHLKAMCKFCLCVVSKWKLNGKAKPNQSKAEQKSFLVLF